MRLLPLSSADDSRSAVLATTLIGIGLAMLIATPFWPAAPVVTAMAIITLGATEITLARFQGNASIVPLMILHGATYASLYVLFVGATLHSASVSSSAGIGLRTAFDLAASIVPVAIAVLRIFSHFRQATMSRR